MAVGFRQFCAIYLETNYGAWANGAAIPIRLSGDNAFKMTPVINRREIRSADAYNRRVVNVAGRTTVTGKLDTFLYWEQAQALLGWASTLDANIELPSYSIQFYDGVRARRYLGCKVKSLKLSTAAESDEGIVKASFDLVAQKQDTDPTFASPAQSAYPVKPIRLVESKYVVTGPTGLILATTGSTARTKYKSIDITFNNELRPAFDEDVYISDCTYNGRTIDMSMAIRFTAKTDRDNYESQASHTASLQFKNATPNTLTFDFKNANYIGGLDDTYPIGDNMYETINVSNFDDIVAGTDFSFTYA